jgi:hypothetical protein
MRRVKTGLIATASAVLLFWGAEVRADKVDWSYNFTPSSTEIMSDSGQSKLILSNEPLGGAATQPNSSTDLVATNIKTQSSVDPSTLDTFTNKAFTLTISLTDETTKQSGSLTFSGLFNGTLNSGAAKIVATITGNLVQSIVLGSNTYTVSMGQPNQFAAPSPPTSTNLGSISANVGVDVSGSPPPSSPEPTSLLLAGLGLTAGAGAWLKNRRRRRTEAAAVLAA